MDVAHLGHLELLTPKPEESLRFFVDVMGMTESGRQGDSVYLRGLGRLRALFAEADGVATPPGLGHAAFRARSPQALERRVEALQDSGLGDRLARGRARPWAGLPVPRSGRPRASKSITRPSGTRRRPSCARAEEPGAEISRRAASTFAGSITSTAWPPTSRRTGASSSVSRLPHSPSRSC